jgi:hypothetical protein
MQSASRRDQDGSETRPARSDRARTQIDLSRVHNRCRVVLGHRLHAASFQSRPKCRLEEESDSQCRECRESLFDILRVRRVAIRPSVARLHLPERPERRSGLEPFCPGSRHRSGPHQCGPVPITDIELGPRLQTCQPPRGFHARYAAPSILGVPRPPH